MREVPGRAILLLLVGFLAGQAAAQHSGLVTHQRRLRQASENAVTATLQLAGTSTVTIPGLEAALKTQLPEATSVLVSSVQTQSDSAAGSVATVNISVLSASSTGAIAIAAKLKTLADSAAFLEELESQGITATSVSVTDVLEPPSSPSSGAAAATDAGVGPVLRDPESLSGGALAGVLVVIAVGALLVVTMAGFGVRSLLQIRDEMAKRKAGYKVVELNGDHHGDHVSSADARDVEAGHFDSTPTAKTR